MTSILCKQLRLGDFYNHIISCGKGVFWWIRTFDDYIISFELDFELSLYLSM